MNAQATRDFRGARDAGFSLIELIVVIVIIGILAAIAVPLFLGALDQARTSAMQAAIANARLAVALAVVDGGELPSGDARAEILAQHGDPDITVALTGTASGFCLSAQHALIAEGWAATQRVVPTQGASCEADGSITLP